MPIPAASTWIRARSDMPRDVIVLAIIAFFVAVGFGVMIPVLPVFARSFEVSNFMVGMVISSFALMRLITSPFCGVMNNWAGERRVLGVGMFIVAGSSAAAGLATSFYGLLLMRAVGGIGSAMFTVAAMTLLLRSVDSSKRGRAAALYSSGFLIGGMTGPAIGGLFASISLTAPFFFYAATLAIAGIVGLVLLTGKPVEPEDGAGFVPPPMKVVVRDVRYQAALLTSFAQGWQSFGVRSALIPVLIVEGLHRPPSWTGMSFAVAAIAQTAVLGPVGRAVDRIGRRPMMIAAGILTGLATLATPFAPNIWVLTAILSVYGIGAAMHATAPAATVGDVLGGRGGTPIAVYSMMSDVGAVIGPLAAGALADSLGMPVAFGIGAALLMSGSLYSLRMPKVDPGPVRTPMTEPVSTP
ncbi:MAG TPA: MFS transporter [Propionibacteriaceae bacterium]|nr:MFS transporter [Propionibacteriaceae bacterium]